jgi:hypothetical protein
MGVHALDEKRAQNHTARKMLLSGKGLLADYHGDLYDRYGLIAFLDLGTVDKRLGDPEKLTYEVTSTLYDGEELYGQMVLFAKGKLVAEGITGGIGLLTESPAVDEGQEMLEDQEDLEKDLERLGRAQDKADTHKKRFNRHLENGNLHYLQRMADDLAYDADKLEERLEALEGTEAGEQIDLRDEIRSLRKRAKALEGGGEGMDLSNLEPFEVKEEEPGEPFSFVYEVVGMGGERLGESDLPTDRRPRVGSTAAIDRPFFHEYLLGIFSSRYDSDARSFDFTGRREEEPVLEEEIGYLLFGKKRDYQNDIALKSALYAQRLAVNILWIAKDPIVAKDLTLFATKLGAGQPVATALIYAASLTGLSAYESACEMPELLDGKGLKMIKHHGDFHFSIGALSIGRATPDGGGEVYYHDHLRMLLFAVPRRTLLWRAMDLIEVDYRRRIGLGFRIEEMVTGFDLTVEEGEEIYEKRFAY